MKDLVDGFYWRVKNDSVRVFTLAALINSSAKHSAIDLMLRNAASRAPVQSNQIAYE